MEQRTSDAGRADLYGQLARIGKVVMHPERVELLDLLCQGERSVEVLAAATGLKLTTASAHLQVMRQARLVETRREATRVYYRAAGEEVCRFVATLGDLARARLAEVEQILREARHRYRGHRAGHPYGIAGPGAGRRCGGARRAADGGVRGRRYPGRDLPPLEHLEARLDEFESAVEVVAYCRGPLCLLAPQAVAALRERGAGALP